MVFLYRIVDGGADHSYGIQVAKLAGLPPQVLRRARARSWSRWKRGTRLPWVCPQQMYMFGPEQPSGPSPIEQELDIVDPDSLSPREAHELVYHLKHLANKPRKKG